MEPPSDRSPADAARYFSGFYPMHLALLAVERNVMPIAWWTPISKEPFRFLIAMDRRNHSLSLLRERREATLNFLGWEHRAAVVRAGYLTGKRHAKVERLGLELDPATRLACAHVVRGAIAAFELRVLAEIDAIAGDHVPFALETVYVHRNGRPAHGTPLLFLGYRDFATLGERWRFRP